MPAQLAAPHVPELTYHKVAELPSGACVQCNYVRPQAFVRQLRFLRAAGYQSISFAQYLAYRRGEGQLPRRPIVISFDDGYKSNFEVALPILHRFGFTATVFLVAGMLGGTNRWDPDDVQEPLLNQDEVRLMEGAGTEFQSHTHTHQRLTTIPRAQALRELWESRLLLEDVVGAPVSVIAYPWGDHDDAVCQLASDAGYRAGVSMRRRTNFDRTPLFELCRIGIDDQTTLARFAWDRTQLRWRGE